MMTVYAQRHAAMLLVAAIIVSADITGLVAPERRVRLLGDETDFRAAFSRFGPNDEQNGLTLVKLGRIGQEAELLHAYDDGTVTVRFDDGREHDMPVEALAVRAPVEAPPVIVEFGSNADQFLQHNCSGHEVAEGHGMTNTPLTATDGSAACDASAGETSCLHLIDK